MARSRHTMAFRGKDWLNQAERCASPAHIWDLKQKSQREPARFTGLTEAFYTKKTGLDKLSMHTSKVDAWFDGKPIAEVAQEERYWITGRLS